MTNPYITKQDLLGAIYMLRQNSEQAGWIRFKHRQMCSNPVDVCECHLAGEYRHLQGAADKDRDDILRYSQ